MLGAFLASTFGAATQLALAHYSDKREIKRSAKLLLADIDQIVFSTRSIAHSLQAVDLESDAEKLNLIRRTRSRTPTTLNWHEHLGTLTNALPTAHILKVRSIYATNSEIEKCLNNGNAKELRSAIKPMAPFSRDEQLLDYGTPTPQDVLDALGQVSDRAMFSDGLWRRCFAAIIFEWKLRTLGPLLEPALVSAVKAKGDTIDLLNLEEQAEIWLSKQGHACRRRYGRVLKKLVFHLVMRSSRLKLTWGQVTPVEGSGEKKTAELTP